MSDWTRRMILMTLFVLGLALGVWTFVSPWIIGFPTGSGQTWTNSIKATLWAGGIVAAGSLIALLLLPVVELDNASRRRRGR